MPTWSPEAFVQSYEMMDEGEYTATIRTAEVAPKRDKNDNKIIEVHMVINDGDYAGRKIKIRRYTSDKALGLVASDLYALDVNAVSSDYDTPTAEEFVDAYNDCAGQDVRVRVKHNADKTDPTKIYENYSLLKQK